MNRRGGSRGMALARFEGKVTAAIVNEEVVVKGRGVSRNDCRGFEARSVVRVGRRCPLTRGIGVAAWLVRFGRPPGVRRHSTYGAVCDRRLRNLLACRARAVILYKERLIPFARSL